MLSKLAVPFRQLPFGARSPHSAASMLAQLLAGTAPADDRPLDPHPPPTHPQQPPRLRKASSEPHPPTPNTPLTPYVNPSTLHVTAFLVLLLSETNGLGKKKTNGRLKPSSLSNESSSEIPLHLLADPDPEAIRQLKSVDPKLVAAVVLKEFLRANVYTKDFRSAEYVLQLMKKRRIPHTTRTLNYLIQMHVTRGNMEAAEDVLATFFPKCGIIPNARSYEKLIIGYLVLWRPRRPTSDGFEKELISSLNGSGTETDVMDDTFLESNFPSEPVSSDSSMSPNAESHASTSANTHLGYTVASTEEHRIEELELKGIKRSLELFQEMIKAGFMPDIRIFDVFMRSHYHRGEYSRVLELFETLKHEKMKADRRIFTVLIETLAVGMRDLHQAKLILEEMTTAGFEVDIYISTILMNAYLQLGDTDNAKRIFSQILDSKTQTPTLHTYGTLVNILCRAGQTQEAHFLVTHEIPRLFSSPTNHITSNHILYNTLIHGYGLKGDLQAAATVVEEMKNLGLKPLITTYNILLSSHVRHSDFKGAWNWYQRLLQQTPKLEPTLVTYNIMIHMHLKDQDPAGAQEMYRTLIQKGIVPDTATIAPMIEYYSQVGDWDKVVKIIESSRAVGSFEGAQFTGKERGRVQYSEIVPHNIVLERMRRDGNTAGVLRRFLELTVPSTIESPSNVVTSSAQVTPSSAQVTPDVATFDILIRSLGSLRDLDAARFWFDDALRRKLFDVRLFNTIMSAYINNGLLEEAKEVYGMIEEYGLVPDPVSVTLLFKANNEVAAVSDDEGTVENETPE
ncbi:UNVERIFIED_CONTAM: hypothetical protein HDU68_012476 [Siphonaria sp. JEL0065]|nr:hypothetical protein HDU68_012476 [Siphonaria sp. JEL0065]